MNALQISFHSVPVSLLANSLPQMVQILNSHRISSVSATGCWLQHRSHKQFCTRNATDTAPGRDGKAKTAATSNSALGDGLTLQQGCRMK